jgi:hypothetical protein
MKELFLCEFKVFFKTAVSPLLCAFYERIPLGIKQS